jgi:hypothetical protein
MSWQTEMVIILRHLIDDLDDGSVEYSDSRLQSLISIAAQLTLEDVVFAQTYTIDVTVPSISPDPTTAPKDDAFINLVCIKARCELYKSIFRLKAKIAGISVKSGSEAISAGGTLGAYKYLADSACQDFKDAKFEYEAGNLIPGKAILGPYAGDAVSWLDTNSNSNANTRYNKDFS